jgi:C1A family cysteine protease
MRSFATAALAGLVAATPMTDMEFKFINYVAKFGKSYATQEEYAFRLEQFA